MILTGRIIPQWDIDQFKQLEYKLDTHKDTELLDQYEAAGHNRDSMSLYNYFEPNPLPSVVYDCIVNQFFYLRNVSVAVNLFKPGQYLPMHVDLFGKYREIHNISPAVEISRTIVMLEASAPGQISHVNNTVLGEWLPGFWIQWKEKTPHAFYNFSMTDRYALQITGTLS